MNRRQEPCLVKGPSGALGVLRATESAATFCPLYDLEKDKHVLVPEDLALNPASDSSSLRDLGLLTSPRCPLPPPQTGQIAPARLRH